MELQVAKWGNSLALRIPSDIVKRLNLREGAMVEAQLAIDGTLSIRPARWNREAFAAELAEARKSMPESQAAIDQVRSGARF